MNTTTDRSRQGLPLFLFAAEAFVLLLFCRCAGLSPIKYVRVAFFELSGAKTVGIALVLILILELRALSSPASEAAPVPEKARAGDLLFLALHLLSGGAFTALSLARLSHSRTHAFLLIPWRVSGLLCFLGLLVLARRRFASPGRRIYLALMSIGAGLIANDVYRVFEAKAWMLLGNVTTRTSCAILGLAYRSLVCSPPPKSFISTAHFRISMFEQCSGHEGIALVSLALGLFLILFRDELRFPRVFLLFPIGMVCSWILNVGRIVVMVGIASSISKRAAVAAFHSYAGSLAFTGLACLLSALALKSRFFSRCKLDLRPLSTDPPVAFLAPFLVVALAGIVTQGIGEGNLEWCYVGRMALGAALLWKFRTAYLPLFGRPFALLVYGAGLAIFAAWSLTILAQVTDADRAFSAEVRALSPQARALWFFFRITGCALVVPVLEELAFRGYLLRRFTAECFEKVRLADVTPIAIVVSSLVFGLLHRHWALATITGGALALLTRRTNRLGDAVLAHAVANALLALTALASGNWFLLN